jgi:hypothetical protein
MPTVQLTDEEWRSVLACMSCAPWRDVNSLLMKIGDQLRRQSSSAIKQTNDLAAEVTKQ